MKNQRGSVKIALIIVMAIVGLFVGSWLLWGYSVGQKAVTGVVERTFDPDNIIYNYEYFKNQHRQILAYDNQIATAKAGVVEAESQPRAERDFRDKEEIARLRTILQGLRNQRDTAVGAYNANARKVNRNIFMGTDVPEQLRVDKQADKTISATLQETATQQ